MRSCEKLQLNMKKIVALSLIILLSSEGYSQTCKTYTPLDGAFETPEMVYKLDLSGQGLKELPTEISKFVNLYSLLLDDNKLTALPESLVGLKLINHLDVKNNQLTAFPESIRTMQGLTMISASYNKFKQIPEWFG